MQEQQITDVVIVGAGPAGLSMAIELGRLGIRCLVVEQNDRVGYSPRAKTTNVRTREHLRRWGIADNLRRASRLPLDYPSDIVFATRLNGLQLAKIENAFCCWHERNDLYSESAQWIPQYVLEEVLRAHAVTLPSVEVRFDCTFLNAEQDADGVTASLRNLKTGLEQTVRGTYMVGADGSRSMVRQCIGAIMEGSRGSTKNYNVQFRAPELAALNPQSRAIQYWMINSDSPSLIGPLDGVDLWYFIATKIDANPEDIDPKKLIRKATNLDFEMEILGTAPWVAHSLVADKYSAGRIFLVGDACHLHPPFGGYGMNMGIADGVDLGWKMGAVLQGWAGPGLLATYQQERGPVHKAVIEEANANYSALGNQLSVPGIEEPGSLGDAARREAGEIIFATKLREFKTLGMVLGYCYEDSAVIVHDGTRAPAQHPMIYRPSAHPGCVAPHLWLKDGSSLYDHFGTGFTLLVTRSGLPDDLQRCQQIANQLKIPVKVIHPDESRLHHRYEANFALIRPDQHVAWRGNEIPEDFASLLNHVSGA